MYASSKFLNIDHYLFEQVPPLPPWGFSPGRLFSPVSIPYFRPINTSSNEAIDESWRP